MEEDLTKAKHYRDQAANLRALAATDDNQKTRNSLISVAAEYDQLYLKFLGLAAHRADSMLAKIKP